MLNWRQGVRVSKEQGEGLGPGSERANAKDMTGRARSIPVQAGHWQRMVSLAAC